MEKRNISRPMITIDKLMSMSDEELNEFIENDRKLLEEGRFSDDESNIDFTGMTDEEIVKRYGFVPMNEYINNWIQKLSNRNGMS